MQRLKFKAYENVKLNSSKCSVFYYGIYNQGMIGIYYNEGWSNNFK